MGPLEIIALLRAFSEVAEKLAPVVQSVIAVASEEDAAKIKAALPDFQKMVDDQHEATQALLR